MFHGRVDVVNTKSGPSASSLGITRLFHSATPRIRPVVAHDQRLFLGGQRATHLQVGHHLEVVQSTEQIQRGDPVLGV